jgi:hypothetical protein
MGSLEGEGQFIIIIVFYYFSAPEICSDKQGALSRRKQFSGILLYLHVHLTSGLI